ncbi:hypothetical protein PG985_000392 [Apiospora marii]|uniref:uncharacterized protein n=1 Tax=Apiospora marii TaxID=335849 RepID=UPI003132084E
MMTISSCSQWYVLSKLDFYHRPAPRSPAFGDFSVADEGHPTPSQAASIASCALTSKAVDHGLGRHIEALSHEDQVAVTTWTYIAFCPGVMSFAIPKLAVIALLVRLMSPRKLHYWILWTMGITVQLTLLATVGILIRVIVEKCPPFNDITLKPPDHCVSVSVQVKWCLFAGSLSAFVDFYLAIYPSVVLYHLQMRRRKKVALSIALGLGVLSGAVAVYKTTHLPALADPDFTWANADLQTWTVCVQQTLLQFPIFHSQLFLTIKLTAKHFRAEGSTIVIASSIPILQPLLEKACGVNFIECRRGRLKTYIEFITSRGKLTTAIQRRVHHFNDSAMLAETDVEAAAAHNSHRR